MTDLPQRAHLLNPMVPGLHGGKMSASDPGMMRRVVLTSGDLTNGVSDSKIDILDPPDVVTKKIRKAEAAPRVVEENGVLAFTEYVLLPAAGLSGRREFRVDRERDGLEPLVYTSVEQMHEDYKNDIVCSSISLRDCFEGLLIADQYYFLVQLSPQLLKPAVAKALVELMAPIQAAFQASSEWQEITLKAYPPAEKKKKDKKVKDKGSRYPGGKEVQLPERPAQ